MPSYVHCPRCHRAYDAAAGPCTACPATPYASAAEIPDDGRLTAALAEIARLRRAIDAIALPPPVPRAVVRFVPTRWASAIARVVGSVRRAWTYAVTATQNS